MTPLPSPTKPTKAVAIDLLPLFDATARPAPGVHPPKKPRHAASAEPCSTEAST